MQPIIKWPGGKSTEIKFIENIIPSHDRLIEPFCGGAALFFYLEPHHAILNDISENLTNFYELIKNENKHFKEYMYDLNYIWNRIKVKSEQHIISLVELFENFRNNCISKNEIHSKLSIIVNNILSGENIDIIDISILEKEMNRTLREKFFRTYHNEIKNSKVLSIQDLSSNLSTGIASGIYMTVRYSFNQLEKTDKLTQDLIAKKTALFYFLREFCYGSMFRYNKNGDFNIPYGGMGYNHKDYKRKLDIVFDNKTIELLKNTSIECGDFEKIILSAQKKDFIFLDPPYDTNFSEYENRAFDKCDHLRLRDSLETTKAKFILIIKNTPFIYSIYDKECFNIKSFDNTYSYCVKNRNDRKAKHLIITNY